jgi:hypothetical protein
MPQLPHGRWVNYIPQMPNCPMEGGGLYIFHRYPTSPWKVGYIYSTDTPTAPWKVCYTLIHIPQIPNCPIEGGLYIFHRYPNCPIEGGLYIPHMEG